MNDIDMQDWPGVNEKLNWQPPNSACQNWNKLGPELLRQLERVLSVIQSTSETAVFDTISIQKVIAKARGEAT